MGFDGDHPTTHIPAHTKDLVRAFVKRIQNVEAEIAEKNTAKSEIYAEAKAVGLDKKTLRTVIRRAGMSPDELSEADTLVELYERCLRTGAPAPARDPLEE